MIIFFHKIDISQIIFTIKISMSLTSNSYSVLVTKIMFVVLCIVLHGNRVEGLHCKCQWRPTITSHSIYPVKTFRRKVTRCTERVILKGQNISEIPKDALVNLPCLERLEIENTRLSEIYYGILNGTNNLWSVAFTSNRISIIQPMAFECLGKLTELKLNHNNVHHITVKQFKGLTYLKILKLNNNEIVTIDEGAFDGLICLIDLSLESNKLRHLNQNTFKGLKSLGSLNLSNNEISIVEPNSFCHLSKLNGLNLLSNYFTHIDKYTFVGMSHLTYLYLSDSLQHIENGTFYGSYSNMYLEVSGEDFPLLTWRVFGDNMNNERKLPDIMIDGSNVSCTKQNCWMKFYYQDGGNFIAFNQDKSQEIDKESSVASIPVQTNTLQECFLALKSSCPGRDLCNLNVTECIKKCNTLGYFTGNVTVDDIWCPFQTLCECLCPHYYSQMSVCDDKCGGKGLGVQDMDLNECPKCIGCVKCIDCEVDCNDTSFYGEEYVNTSEATSNCKMSCLDCHTRKSDDLYEAFIPAVLVSSALFVMICIFIFIVYRLWQNNQDGELVLDFGYQGDLKLVLLINNIKPDIAEEVKMCWIDPKSFTLGHLLGHGNFGTVWSGTYYQGVKLEMKIAIKKIRGSRDVNDVENFLQEATVMRQFNHPNVLSLIGVSVHEDKPCILLPLMDNGALKSYLLANRSAIADDMLLMFALGVSKGMEYLAEQKFVHRDLAARNCMLETNLVVKIADFGLTREVYETEYYRIEDQNKGLPIRWMSIEAIRESVFTTKSDVWSYGVLLWEVYTFGAQPYQGLKNIDIEQYLVQGKRLSKPAKASNQMYKIMCNCWNAEPENRPRFTYIKETLNRIADEQKDYLEVAPSTISQAFDKDPKETLKEGEAPPVPMRRPVKQEPRKPLKLNKKCSETHHKIGQTNFEEDQT